MANLIDITHSGLKSVHYFVQVEGKGEPVMLLHGFTGSGEVWAELVSALAERFTIIGPDLLGHGLTDTPDDPARYDIDLQARDLIALGEALGYPRFALHGYSMGGRLALYLAERYPEHVTALSLESASPGLATAQEREARIGQDEALATRIERDGVAAFVDSWEKLALFDGLKQIPTEQQARLRAIRLNQRPTGLANSLRGMGTGRQPSLWDGLGRYGGKRLVITGADDTKFCAIGDDMAERVSGTQRITVPEAGHTVHLEQPGRWTAAVLDFLGDALG